MKRAFLVCILLSTIASFSQEESKERFLFENKLTLVTQKDTVVKHIKVIKEISVASSADCILSNSEWELLYLHETGWQESRPNDRHDINSLYMGKPNNIVTGKDLKDFLSLLIEKKSC
jgi:hypothetical protein